MSFNKTLGAILLTAAAMQPYQLAEAGLSTPVTYLLPQQPLTETLLQLGKKAEVSILVNSALIKELQAPALTGTFQLREALDQVLAGTGLSYRVSGQQTIIILATVTPKEQQLTEPVAQPDAPTYLSEIVVTAQRRPQNLQEVPISITVHDEQSLWQNGMTSLEDISTRTPGLVYAAFNLGQPEIAIRGIGTKEDGAAAGDSTIISIDDVYIAGRTMQALDLFDLERIEVLRGPQSTLYGKNSIGGSINLVTRKPSDQFTYQLRSKIGNYGRFDFGSMISGPLSDSLKAKLSVNRRSYDGHFTNLFTGQRRGKQENLYWRGQLLWQPTDTLETTLTLYQARDDIGDQNRKPAAHSDESAQGDNLDPIAVNKAFGGNSNPWTSLGIEKGFSDREIYGVSLKAAWDFTDFQLTSITAYNHGDYQWLTNSTGVPGTANTLPGPASDGYRRAATDSANEKTRQFSQEFRLSYNAERHHWLAGLFYSSEHIIRDETLCLSTCQLPGRALLIRNTTPRRIVETSLQDNDAFSWAAYGQGSLKLTDRLELTLGLRYSYEKKRVQNGADIDQGSYKPGQVEGSGIFFRQDFTSNAEADWDNISAQASLRWQLTENLNSYLSLASGFKSGGFTGAPSTPERATTPFEAEQAINYELGFKYRLADKLIINIAGFYTQYSDLQVTRFYRPADAQANFGEFITENAAAANIRGFELEFTAFPIPNLELGGSLALLDAEYSRFNSDIPNQGTGPNGTGPCAADSSNLGIAATGKTRCLPDFSDNQLRQAPKRTASLNAKYTHILQQGLGQVSLGVNYRFQDLSYFDPDNNPITVIPRYRLWDTRIAWESADKQWEVAGWINNINNEHYRTHVFSTISGTVALALFGPPQTYGISIKYEL